MHMLSPRGVSEHFHLSKIVGKKVIAQNGEVVGRVKEVAFDLNRIIGFIVQGKIGVGQMLVDVHYVEQYHEDSVILKISPVTSLIGKIVFDSDGKRVGRIKELVRAGTANDFTDLMVSRGAFRKAQKVPKSDMQVVGKNIILNKAI